MGKLIRFEFRKLFRSRYFYVVMGIAMLFIVMTGITYTIIKALVAGGAATGVTTTSYSFIKGALGNNFTILIAVFVAIAATEDNASGTMKNVIGRGYSRLKVFLSKYLVSLIAVIIISALVVLVAILYGTLAFDKGEITDNLAVIICGQLFSLVAYHAVFYAIASGFGKIGPAIAVCIIGPMGVTLALTIANTALAGKTGLDKYLPGNYWLDGLFANFTNKANPIGDAACFGLLFGYFIVALFIGFMINRKREY